MTSSTAALLVIGNEILSGRTQDLNMAFLGKSLGELGIPLREIRVVADVESDIIHAVNALRTAYTYVFTTGGIGPTHDDITSECIAKAFGHPYIRNAQAEAMLRQHYGDQINEARLTMADMPEGAKLIPNPVSTAPAFQVENVYVMAGVPRIMQAMFAEIKPGLLGGPKILSHTLTCFVTEGAIAERLSAIQETFPEVEIGSYPFAKDGKLGTSIVLRGVDQVRIDSAAGQVHNLLSAHAPVTEEAGS